MSPSFPSGNLQKPPMPSFPRKRAREGMDAVADAKGGPKGDRRKRSQSILTLRTGDLDSRFRGNDAQKDGYSRFRSATNILKIRVGSATAASDDPELPATQRETAR